MHVVSLPQIVIIKFFFNLATFLASKPSEERLTHSYCVTDGSVSASCPADTNVGLILHIISL